MESNKIRLIVAQWRKQKGAGIGNFAWTVNARIFFEGARALAQATADQTLIADIDLVLEIIDTQGINPLLAMARPD